MLCESSGGKNVCEFAWMLLTPLGLPESANTRGSFRSYNRTKACSLRGLTTRRSAEATTIGNGNVSYINGGDQPWQVLGQI
jgi:hypothetical protein